LVQHANLGTIGIGANAVTSLYGRHAVIIQGTQRIANSVPRDALRWAHAMRKPPQWLMPEGSIHIHEDFL
jgi:hypothetical protein